MSKRALAALAMAVCIAFSAAADDKRPNTTSREWTVSVAQRRDVPADCIAIPVHGAHILVPGEEIARRAAVPTKSWTTEEERLAQIDIRRAQQLLDTMSSERMADGCRIAEEFGTNEIQYLVFSLMKDGKTCVRLKDADGLSPRLDLHYNDIICGPLCGSGMVFIVAPGADAPCWRSSSGYRDGAQA